MAFGAIHEPDGLLNSLWLYPSVDSFLTSLTSQNLIGERTSSQPRTLRSVRLNLFIQQQILISTQKTYVFVSLVKAIPLLISVSCEGLNFLCHTREVILETRIIIQNGLRRFMKFSHLIKGNFV